MKDVPDPSEAELLAFFEEYKNNVPGLVHLVYGAQLPTPDPGFKEPRRVKLNYVLGDVNSVRDKLRDSITDEEIADYYERNKRTLFEKKGSSSRFDENLFKGDPAEEAEESTEAESTEAESTEADSTEAETTDSIEKATSPESGESASEVDEVSSEPAATEEAVDEATDEPEVPADDKSSRVTTPSNIRLVAFQDNEESTEEPVSEEEASSETAATSETDASNNDTEKTKEEVEYEPLEDVKDTIRDKLATDKAVVELKDKIDDIYGELVSEYNVYGSDVVKAEMDEAEIPAPPKTLTNLKERAAAAGLISEETLLVTQRELADTFVGKAIDAQTGRQYVVQAAFSSLKPYEPILAQDLDGNWYLVTVIQDVPEKIPPFEDIRDEVLAAWKQQQAAKLALEQSKRTRQAERRARGFASQFHGRQALRSHHD